MNYPEEWDELPKRERKKKIKELRREKAEQRIKMKKILIIAGIVGVTLFIVAGYSFLTRKSPEEVAFEQEVEKVTLEGKVEEFDIEGKEHVAAGTDVKYKTNPPSSGDHYAVPADWGIYDEELTEEAVVHSIEHGGIWIAYQDTSDEERSVLEEIGRENSQSVIVSPRSANDAKISIVSWGRMMKLESVDKAIIQKYINTYKNQSPEPLAR